MNDWDELIAHQIDAIGVVDVYDIRTPLDIWVAQVRVNHHRRNAQWLYPPGDPISFLAATLTDEELWEQWLLHHKCQCES